MTIEQALKQWKIGEKKLLKMLSEGKITGLRTENNIIILPDLPKLFQVPPNAKRTAGNIYKYTLSAVSQGCYLDANLFGNNFNLSDSDFKDYAEILERCGYIVRKSSYTDSFSTLGFMIPPDKLGEVDKIIHYEGEKVLATLAKIKPDINVNIGCIDIL